MDLRVDPRLQSFIPSPTSQSSSLPGAAPPRASLSYYGVATNQEEVGGAGDGEDANAADLKRPRACESCRSLKVKCQFDDDSPDAPCKRCAKAKRKCVITAPTRRRQKKADSRVAELEKKIDALQAAIVAARSGNPNGSSPEDSDDADESAESQPRRASSGAVIIDSPTEEMALDSSIDGKVYGQKIGHKRRRSEGPRRGSETSASPHHSKPNDLPPSEDSSTVYPFLMPKGAASRPSSVLTPESFGSIYNGNEYADVIDRRLIGAQEAAAVFDRYVAELCPILPLVSFKPGTTAAEVRRSKPILFLAILAAGSGILHVDLQRSLTKEVSKMFAERILVNGEKSLEIVQALHVSVAWYWPPENYEELKFYQMTHIAATMAIDIGINQKSRSPKDKPLMPKWREQFWKRATMDPMESMKAWLACYYLCSATSMSLRRPKFLYWTAWMDDCVEFVENSPEATTADKSFCKLIRLQKIADEVGIEFAMDDPSVSASMLDPKTQYALKGFEQQIQKWQGSCKVLQEQPFLKMNEYVIVMYVHEVAMHGDHSNDDFSTPFTLGKQEQAKQADSLSTAHINALVAVFTAAHQLVETFLSMDIKFIRALPVFQFVRMSYAMVALIKMYFASAVVDSTISKVLPKEDIKAGYYLDKLLERYREAAENDNCRPAHKFSMILKMLQQWYLKGAGMNSKEMSLDCPVMGHMIRNAQPEPANYSNIRSTSLTSGDTPSATPEYGSASTPLQLLSEVASTGVSAPSAYNATSAGMAGTMGAGSTTSAPWYGVPMASSSMAPSMGGFQDYGTSFLGAFSNTIESIDPQMNFGMPNDLPMFDFSNVDELTMNTIMEGFPSLN